MRHNDKHVSPLGDRVEEEHRRSFHKDLEYRAAAVKLSLAAECARMLIAYRMRHNFTQKKLGKLLQMPESAISRLERGDHVPNLGTLCRIAERLGKRLVFQDVKAA